jgi:hypothetical protein
MRVAVDDQIHLATKQDFLEHVVLIQHKRRVIRVDADHVAAPQTVA